MDCYSFESDKSDLNKNEARHEKIIRFWNKKLHKINVSKVRYGCRQNLANQRFRYQGRFIKREELDKLNPTEVYDPFNRTAPKTKQIFKIHKDQRNGSSHSSVYSSLRDESNKAGFMCDLQNQAEMTNLFSSEPQKVFAGDLMLSNFPSFIEDSDVSMNLQSG